MAFSWLSGFPARPQLKLFIRRESEDSPVSMGRLDTKQNQHV